MTATTPNTPHQQQHDRLRAQVKLHTTKSVRRRRTLLRVRSFSASVTHRATLRIESSNAITVASDFGLNTEPRITTILPEQRITPAPGTIIAITGPSGSGKSSVIKALQQRIPSALLVQEHTLPPHLAVIDGVMPDGSLQDATHILTACALSEPRLWLSTPDTLSEGEAFRATLARTIATACRTPHHRVILCDEFTSNIHRRMARTIACNVRKLVTRYQLSMIIATAHDDILPDLAPEQVISTGANDLLPTSYVATPTAWLDRFTVQQGRKSDYTRFAAMHYREHDEPGFIDSVFLLIEKLSNEPVGIVVYAYGPPELSLRNKATGGVFVKNMPLLNKNMRMLKRLVIHPDLRGTGLGHHLVRSTLPLVGTAFVECLASFGRYHPVFEKAGMTWIGQSTMPPRCKRAVAALQAMGIDVYSSDFSGLAAASPRAISIMTAVVHDWYRATTIDGHARAVRQSPQLLARLFRKLVSNGSNYYLWQRPQS